MAKSKKPKSEVAVYVEHTTEYLSPQDLLKCETLSRDIQNSKLAMGVEEQYLKNLLLESELLKFRIEKQKMQLLEKSKLYEGSKLIYNSYVAEMWPRYGIDKDATSVGYDDITGKIVK